MFFSSIVRSNSCIDEKNQNKSCSSSFRFTSKLLELGVETGSGCFLARSALARQTRSNQRLTVLDLMTLARDPRLCYDKYFQSISHRLRGRLNQKQGEKMNIKKCLITIVSTIFITAVTHAQEASEDLTAEKRQLAQQKAELDAREKALDRREKKLAEKEKATASSTLRTPEKGKATAKHQQAIAQSQEEQAKAARAEKKLHEPFFQRLDEAFLEQLGTPAYTPPDPNAPNTRRIPPPPFDSPPFPSGDWQINGTPIIGDPGQLAPYPLMQAIYEGPGGQQIKDSKVQLYGWVNCSGNISTSHPSKKS